MSRVRRASPLPTVRDIDQGHPQPHFQAMAGRRKRRESRALPLSSRQSRLTAVCEINNKSPAIFLSWTALSRNKLSIATLARHGRPSRSHGTPAARSSGYPPRAPPVLTIRSDARALQPHETLYPRAIIVEEIVSMFVIFFLMRRRSAAIHEVLVPRKNR